MLTKFPTSSHDEWLALRSKYLGGSDAAAVVGLNPNVSPFSLWMEKTGKAQPFEGNLATQVGTYLEDFVAHLFMEATDKKVRRENASLVNSDYPFAIANVDRLVVGEDAGLEIKTCSSLALKKFRNGEYPAKYYVQCVHYLAVTGRAKWYLAVLIGNHDFRVFEIERDEDEIAALMAQEKAFWEDHVLANVPPAPDGEDPTDESIRTLYPESIEGSSVELFGRDKLLERWFDLAAQVKELQRQQEEIKQTLQLDLGDTEVGLADGYKVIWKSQTRTTFDAKQFTLDHPELNLSKYWKVSASRTFRINKTNKKESEE